VKRVQRIELMTKDNDIFSDKRDKQTGKYYRANKAYALFAELSLPSHLSVDYFQTYKAVFKSSKIKNLLRQILLSMGDVTTFSEFYTSNQLDDFFDFLPLSTENILFSIDNIPLKLKLEYLSALSKNAKLNSIATELYDET
jgi:hypothetical protein